MIEHPERGLLISVLVLLAVYILSVAGYLLYLARSVRAVDGAHRHRRVRGMRMVLIGMWVAEIALLFGSDRVELPAAGWVLWSVAVVLTFLASVQIEWWRRALVAQEGATHERLDP